jgi:hypothetical protein
MFRKIAIALVAASALTVPVLAQTSTSTETKLSPSTSAPSITSTEKTDQLTTKPTKHRMGARRHHHGGKMAKVTKSHGPKMAKYAKYGKAKYGKAKYGKYVRPMKHGKTASFMSTARASAKPISAKATKPIYAKATKQSLSKRGAKPSLH